MYIASISKCKDTFRLLSCKNQINEQKNNIHPIQVQLKPVTTFPDSLFLPAHLQTVSIQVWALNVLIRTAGAQVSITV